MFSKKVNNFLSLRAKRAGGKLPICPFFTKIVLKVSQNVQKKLGKKSILLKFIVQFVETYPSKLKALLSLRAKRAGASYLLVSLLNFS